MTGARRTESEPLAPRFWTRMRLTPQAHRLIAGLIGAPSVAALTNRKSPRVFDGSVGVLGASY